MWIFIDLKKNCNRNIILESDLSFVPGTDNKVKLHNVKQRTYSDFHIWPDFLERISRVAINAGAGSINERNGNVGSDLADSL